MRRLWPDGNLLPVSQCLHVAGATPSCALRLESVLGPPLPKPAGHGKRTARAESPVFH